MRLTKRICIVSYENGKCWDLKFRRDEYNTCIVYGFWRFGLHIDKKGKDIK